MPTKKLSAAITKHPFRPAGIQVSPDLMADLELNGEVIQKKCTVNGVIIDQVDESVGPSTILPVYQDDIVVEVDLSLGRGKFLLPSKPKT